MKFDLYLRGKLWRVIQSHCIVGALNKAHAIIGEVKNGRIVAIRSDVRGAVVGVARELSANKDDVLLE
jgi:hypothetical protein